MPWREITSRQRILLLLLGVALILGFLHWRCAYDPELYFLARHRGANWIVYPVAPEVMLHRAGHWSCTFRRELILPTPPAQAILNLRAFTSAQIILNDQNVPLPGAPDANWKRLQTVTLTPQLRAGTNELRVTVINSNGPPALWLTLNLDGKTVGTDETWEASLVGAAGQSAVRAGASRQIPPGSSLDRGQENLTVLTALAQDWPRLLLIAVLVGALWYAAGWSARGTKPYLVPLVVMLVSVPLWIGLAWHNATILPVASVGFDTQHHLDYINFIQTHGRIPYADDGFQMFQAPLYYLLSAKIPSLAHVSLPDPSALLILRGLSLTFGLVHFICIFLAARLLFPSAATPQCLAIILGGFMPMLLYLSNYVTNEAPMAALVAVATVICLRMLRQNNLSVRWCVALGVVLGAALLTKITALIPFVVILLALTGRLSSQPRPFNAWLSSLGSLLLASFAVCGWYYLQVWERFGSPIVLSWDAVGGFRWWQEPGYSTSDFFLRFGAVLQSPFFAGTNSFLDGLFSTLWGDGLGSGISAFDYRPPWNHALANAGYALAIVPTLLIILGCIVVARRWLLQPTAEQFLLLGMVCAFLAAIAYICLKAPFFASAKAFYGLSALIPLSVLAATGWNTAFRWNKHVGIILGIVSIVFAINTFSSLWIRRATASTSLSLLLHKSVDGATETTLQRSMEATQRHPNDVKLASLTATFLAELKRPDEALIWSEKALKLSPTNASALLQHGQLLKQKGDLAGAIEHFRAAIKFAPALVLAYYHLGSALQDSGHTAEALTWARKGIAVSPGDEALHVLTGALLLQSGSASEAETRLRFALDLGDTSPRIRLLLGHALTQQGQAETALAEFDHFLQVEPENVTALEESGTLLLALNRPLEAVKRLERALQIAPDAVGSLNNLAWLRATSSDPNLRDGTAATRMAQRAMELTKGKEPQIWGTLAAAQAEAGQFQEAVESCRQAISLADAAHNAPLATRNRELLRLYESKQPYRENLTPPTTSP